MNDDRQFGLMVLFARWLYYIGNFRACFLLFFIILPQN